jgi:hypothetical protein
MKNKIYKLIAIAMMSVVFSSNIYGQKITRSSQKAANEKMIPVLVSQNFVNEYPKADPEWRGYPKENFSSEWYEYNPSKQSSKPSEFYVAEFTEFQTDFKAIYSADGNKVAIHRMFVSELPGTVLEGINKGSYSTWNIAGEKEEIYRNNAMGSMKVYRVTMSKGTAQHDLFYSEGGALLMDKTIQ